MAPALTTTDLPKLKLVARGKVRDIYALPDIQDADKLLFVATDRISAFDVVMENGIPNKGSLLTSLSLFWFSKLSHIIPNHVISPDPSTIYAPHSTQADLDAIWTANFPRSLDEYRSQLEGRSMIVKKCEVVKVEAIVRGYITGSGWNEYKKSGTVHGIPMPKGLVESQKLEKPLFTPSTKADMGDHDENIHPDKVKDICGEEIANEIEKVSIQLYTEAANHAASRGVILADTKFEFGLLPSSSEANAKPELILIDEVLTPDSSRYWSAETYVPGQPQDSFDKQYVRDWLISEGKKAVEGVRLPEDVVKRTEEKYREAKERIIDLAPRTFVAARERRRGKVHVVLISSGSVASIKIPFIVQALLSDPEQRFLVQVIATQASSTFYSAEEVESISVENGMGTRTRVWTDSDEWDNWKQIGDPILHIELRRWADLVIIAPCSANTLAKISQGLCDNLATSFLRALTPETPTFIFPAMNTMMWLHPLTAHQIKIMEEVVGYTVVGPQAGKELACGDTGPGAMTEWKEIVQLVKDQVPRLMREKECQTGGA